MKRACYHYLKKQFYNTADTCWQVSYAEQNGVQILKVLATSLFLNISRGCLIFFYFFFC